MRINAAKKIKIEGEEGTSYCWIIVDKLEKTVELRLAGGKAPKWEEGITALLLDKDIKKMVREYCTTAPRKNYFNFNTYEGMSGCRDIKLNIVKFIGGKFRIIKKVSLLHISCYGKLNQGITSMWVGDFVELAEFLYQGIVSQMLTGKRPEWAHLKYIYEPTFGIDDVCHSNRCKSYLTEE